MATIKIDLGQCCIDRDKRYRANTSLFHKLLNATIFRAEIKQNEEWRKSHPDSPSLTRCDVCGNYIVQTHRHGVVFTSPVHEAASAHMTKLMLEERNAR